MSDDEDRIEYLGTFYRLCQFCNHQYQLFSLHSEDLAFIRDQFSTSRPDSCGGLSLIAWCYRRVGVSYHVFGATNSALWAQTMFLTSASLFWPFSY